MQLNQRAWERCQRLVQEAARARVAVTRDETGVQLIDCGVHVSGGLHAGIALAEICLADLAQVSTLADSENGGLAVAVSTDHPLWACLGSQYAGWQVAGDAFFGMGSGPMRLARGREPVLEALGLREAAQQVVGVLEASRLPPPEVCRQLAAECGVAADDLILAIAPTSSLAGTVQVVARSIETALHKMHEVGFDVRQVQSGYGTAPLPPVAADDLTGIGRTNDAVLYGGEVTLWVRGSDQQLCELGPQIPSSASADHGRPFLEIFERYERDFYRIDPLLFSPAVITLNNLETGKVFRFGQTVAALLQQSFDS